VDEVVQFFYGGVEDLEAIGILWADDWIEGDAKMSMSKY
jgi:hypothetical protein